ncbi:hypothetical protein L2Z53_11950 (plasmid) [Macrococcoides canis]|uniref:hypothetical protein n=1 Tax=Macrococcoides canis TaxID=1855823 RepID=UPI001F24178A|nr:hypothetical protein [Macrococcus canis]UJS29048.1 hypothetical protein L2Z53_11950 [Macrococcus canis]
MENTFGIIQTIAAVVSIILAIYGLILQYKSNKNEKSISLYQNNGIHTQNSYQFNNHQQQIIIQQQKYISKQKNNFIKYYHNFFTIMLIIGIIYELYILYKNHFFDNLDFNLFNGMIFTNLLKIAVQCIQSGIAAVILINILSSLFFIIYILIKFKTKIRYLIPTLVILLSNSYIFYDLLHTNYSKFVINQFQVNEPINMSINFVLVIFLGILMILIACNNTILAIYIFDLESYKNQFGDFLSRGLIITLTIIIFMFFKWTLLNFDWIKIIIQNLLNKI